jgi:hypothetical protein
VDHPAFESITGIEPALFLLGKQVHHHLCVIDIEHFLSLFEQKTGFEPAP